MIHVDDIGTVFTATVEDSGVVVDISTATEVLFLFKPPRGSVDSRTGVLVGGGTTGLVKYVIVSGDLDVAGTWTVQIKVTFGNESPSRTFYSDLNTFTVAGRLA